MRRAITITLAVTSIVVIVLDQVTKAIAVASLTPGVTTPVIEGALHWTLQRNPGAAFGLFQRFPVVFTVLASAISIAIIARVRAIPDRAHAFALGLVLGGALGNLTDRLVRSPGVGRGHVVDFIDLRVWPVFNVADAGVVVGVFALLLVTWRAERSARAEANRVDA